MPKIIVREKDLSSSGSSAANNFTVLIPGFVKAECQKEYTKEAKEFDGKAVELVDFKRFEEVVGVVANKVDIEAKAPTVKIELANPDKDTYDAWATDYNKQHVKIYKVVAVPDGQDVGYLKAENKTYVEATAFETDTTYAIIEIGNEGNDAIQAATEHYGNQMAAELLQLGYTVLYTKIDSLADLQDENFWKPFKDKSIFNFRYVVTGLLSNNDKENQCILDLVAFDKNADSFETIDTLEVGRGDAKALIDVDETLYIGKDQIEAVKVLKTKYNYGEKGKYADIFAPAVEFENLKTTSLYDKNDKLPGSFYYLACAAEAFKSYSEWFAVTGYSRGYTTYKVKDTAIHFGEYAINALQPRKKEYSAINLIVKFRNKFYLWGNRTAYVNTDNTDLVYSDFANIRQLCITLKKVIYEACRKYTFDQNNDVLWTNFVNAIRPTLEKMKADEGVYGYKIAKIPAVDSVGKRIKGMLKSRIRIVPMEAVEDFDIGVTLEDSISGTVVSFDE